MNAGILHLIRCAVVVGIMAIASAAFGQSLERGPYLQQGSDTSVIVRWRTDQNTDSVVRFGAAPGALTSSTTSAAQTSEHEVQLSGLAPDTVYFYSVGSTVGPVAGDDQAHFFRTSPVPGTVKDTRLWVLGDSGTGGGNAATVRDAYLDYTGNRTADLLLMLGDNAYGDGTDAQYQNAMFDMYPMVLRQTPVWSTLGNHDGHTADSATQTGPYYDIFSFPKQAEAGGLASGTEAYYSFDYGNIHFISLESYETDRSPGGAMLTWLADDLAATTRTWIVAFWHHPPYTKGSHDSDTETPLIQMRENALPILESHGVDLVLTGHSHAYERSFLIDGHYGNSGSFGAVHQVDGGDGRDDSDGSYDKAGGPGAPNAGAVYSVAGSSGQTSGGSLDHDAMFISLNTLGSMVIDINGNRLDAVFLAADGNVDDYFTITKGPDVTSPTLEFAEAVSNSSVLLEYSEVVDAAAATDLANYNIDGAQVTAVTLQADARSVLLTTSTLLEGVPYVLTVNAVPDLAGNVIAPASQISFTWRTLLMLAFQNGVSPDANYDGMRDTWLDESQTSSNNGASTVLLVDGNDGGGNDLSTLMGWDISAIPAGSVVVSASLTINVFNPSVSGYGIYEIKRAWQENEATWNNYANALGWQAGGAKGSGDRGNVALGNVSSAATGLYTAPLNVTGVALVQAWVDGSVANNGLIVADESSSDGLDFDSSEWGTPAQRPRLDVTYALPADNDGDGIPDADDNCSLVANADQRDTNGDGYGNICDTDLDNNGAINFLDLGAMKAVFFSFGDLDADIDGDGSVNFLDLGYMKSAFFGSPGPSGVAP